jgi:hypothetical protein
MPGEDDTTAETAEETASVDETAAPAETEDAKVETPAEPAEGEKKPEGEPKEEPPAAAKPAEIPEDVLKAAAQKFANRTMAAARRAETTAKQLTSENARLKESVGKHDAQMQAWRANPAQVIRDLNFSDVKSFVQAIIDTGGAPKAPTADEKVAQLEKLWRDEKEANESARVAAAVEQSRNTVFGAIDKLTDRYDFATTEVGHEELWDAITEYHSLHGDCPDEAVFALADEVEKTLSAKFANVKRFRQDPGAKTGQPAAKQAANAARGSGKTLAGSSQAGAPGKREYSLDPEERRKQVVEDMRAAGEL